jgi:cell division protease FtsH
MGASIATRLTKILAPAAPLPVSRNVADRSDFAEAIHRIQLGLKKEGRVMTDDEKRRVAFHEAGHALVALSVVHADPVHRVTIIPRSIGALGAALQLPTEERYVMTAGCDLKPLALDAFSGIGRRVGARTRLQRRTSRLIDAEIRKMLDGEHARARGLLHDRREALDAIARELLARETLERAELEAIVREHSIGDATAQFSHGGSLDGRRPTSAGDNDRCSPRAPRNHGPQGS